VPFEKLVAEFTSTSNFSPASVAVIKKAIARSIGADEFLRVLSNIFAQVAFLNLKSLSAEI
jgi:hypothetical protein